MAVLLVGSPVYSLDLLPCRRCSVGQFNGAACLHLSVIHSFWVSSNQHSLLSCLSPAVNGVHEAGLLQHTIKFFDYVFGHIR